MVRGGRGESGEWSGGSSPGSALSHDCNSLPPAPTFGLVWAGMYRTAPVPPPPWPPAAASGGWWHPSDKFTALTSSEDGTVRGRGVEFTPPTGFCQGRPVWQQDASYTGVWGIRLTRHMSTCILVFPCCTRANTHTHTHTHARTHIHTHTHTHTHYNALHVCPQVRVWDTHNIAQKTVIKPSLAKPVSGWGCKYQPKLNHKGRGWRVCCVLCSLGLAACCLLRDGHY